MTQPESWARYDEWLDATMTDLETEPFTDWAHPHTLFPYVRAVVNRHFQVSENGKDLVAASLVGGMVAAKRGGDDNAIAEKFRDPWSRRRREGASPVQTAYDELERFNADTAGD